jgi:hypothetical protein
MFYLARALCQLTLSRARNAYMSKKEYVKETHNGCTPGHAIALRPGS